jgi:aminomethyltransferase
LQREKEQGSRYRFVILDVDGNKPADHSFIMKGNKVVGSVTSAAWCPTAKSNVAFAQLEMPYGNVGDEFVAEIYYQRELHWTRVLAPCKVVKSAVFNPPRRRATPALAF